MREAVQSLFSDLVYCWKHGPKWAVVTVVTMLSSCAVLMLFIASGLMAMVS